MRRWWRVARILWHYYKLGVSLTLFGIILITILTCTGWILTIDDWWRTHLNTDQFNPITFWSVLLAVGMARRV